ncbi:MAG TPA: hypothetical protein VK361_06735 [Rubrobacteraceae bacterium]|nr:hypothetical protein [Rubrobacteraceae bacterium]
MQGPWGHEISQGIDGYEQMVNTFADQAKLFGGRWDRRASRWLWA